MKVPKYQTASLSCHPLLHLRMQREGGKKHHDGEMQCDQNTRLNTFYQFMTKEFVITVGVQEKELNYSLQCFNQSNAIATNNLKKYQEVSKSLLQLRLHFAHESLLFKMLQTALAY